MAAWDSETLDEYIAPGFSRFTEAEIPDLRPEFPGSGRWLIDHLLNSALGTGSEEPQRQLVLGYLRRAQHAFNAFHSARELTDAYLSARGSEDPGIDGYFAAVSEWEWFAVDYAMAVELHNRLFGRRVFQKGDRSPQSRLHTIANNVKHTAHSLDVHPQGIPAVPLWLNNWSLRSYAGVSITYRSAAEVLRDAAHLADELSTDATMGVSRYR